MSVSFSGNQDQTEAPLRDEACMCAQLSRRWLEAYDAVIDGHEISADLREDLAKDADPKCHRCAGTGVEKVAAPDYNQFFNLANGNARLLLGALGLECDDSHDIYGSCDIATARRAIMRALNRSNLTTWTREGFKETRTRAVAGEGNVTEIRSSHVISCGLDEVGLRQRIERLSAFVEDIASKGATRLDWG